MKIVKAVVLFSVVCSFLFVSCGTSKKNENVQNPEAPLESVEEKQSADNETEKSGKKAKKAKKSEKIEKNEAAEIVEEKPAKSEISDKETENTSKNYTGWIDSTRKNLDVKTGLLRLRTRTKLGTYNIYVQNSDAEYIPVLSTANESASSYFVLKADKKIIKLMADGNVKTYGRLNGNSTGFGLKYVVDKIADVELDFDAFSSTQKSDSDMIKVTATVTNRGSKTSTFTLKSIWDTVLGESTQYHFYTSQNVPVKNEVMYRTMQNEKWLMSKNNKAKMQIFFDGADISKTDYVALANYSTLDIKTWEPDMLNYRAFDTVLSYNNSAIGVAWPEAKLRIDESVSYVFYMAFATDTAEPNGEAYIFANTVTEPDVESKEFTASSVSVPVVVESQQVITPVENIEVDNTVPEVSFDVSKVTKEQLSSEYIQNLLDRIAALEEDDKTVNREELLQLNAELDAILETLKQ